MISIQREVHHHPVAFKYLRHIKGGVGGVEEFIYYQLKSQY